MIVVAGLVRMKPGTHDTVARLLEDVARETRTEPGCISYNMHPTSNDGWFIFEEWEHADALAAHLSADHTRKFLAAAMPLVSAPPALQKYHVSSSGPLL